VNEHTPKEQRAATPLSRRQQMSRRDATSKVEERSKMLRRIARRNHRHRILVFSCKFTPLQPWSPRFAFLLSSDALLVFAFVFLTCVASFFSPSSSRLLSVCWSVRTLGISIRRRISTTFFRMPRGRSETDETCRSNGIFSTTFPAFLTSEGRCVHCRYVC